MFRLLLILWLASNFTACKETKVAALPKTASLSGELHYRTYCTTGKRAPVLATPPPIVYLTDASGAMVVSPVNLNAGRFSFPRIPTTGTFALHTLTWGTSAFFSQGATHESLPISIADLKPHYAGALCVDNDPPVFEVLTAEYSSAITSLVHDDNRLNLPRHAGLITLKARVSDPDHDSRLRVEYFSPSGTLTETGNGWTWDLASTEGEYVTLHATVNDARGGQTKRLITVRLYENVLFPKPETQRYNMSLAGDRAKMTKTVHNTTGRWSFSECCLIAVQYESTVPNRHEATAPELLFTGLPVSAETKLTVYNLGADAEFGLRISDTTPDGGYLDAVLSNRGGEQSWKLKQGNTTLATGPLQDTLLRGTFRINISYAPADRLFTLEVSGASGETTGATLGMARPVFTLAKISLVLENVESDTAGITYVGFHELALHGGNPGIYRLPAAVGEYDGAQFDDGIFSPRDTVHAFTAFGEFSGTNLIEMPLSASLHRALILLPDGRQVTVYTDDKERVLAWMPADALLYEFSWNTVVPTAVPHVFLYD